MTVSLSIGLDSWIVQDGNYGDFKVGERTPFALEFGGRLARHEHAEAPVRAMKHVENFSYEITGLIVHLTDEWWVIDAGVRMFCEQRPPEGLELGTWVTGEIDLGVDPFFYFERLAHQDGVPALIYDWVIEAISIQTAPFIEVEPRLMARDPTKLAWKPITETQATLDDGGHAQYVLHCRRDGNDPRHER